jgi:hypothetical protein
MVRAELMGSHSHHTTDGVRVHVWQRAGHFLARGSYRGQRFGETLGRDVAEATARLRRLLGEIEDGSYLRPTEARRRPLSRGSVPRLTLRQLSNEYLSDRRRLRGQRTAATYRARLLPVLEFAERPAIRQRWPLAWSIDREFGPAERPGHRHPLGHLRPGRIAVPALDWHDAVRSGAAANGGLRGDPSYHPRRGTGQAEYSDQQARAGRNRGFCQPRPCPSR